VGIYELAGAVSVGRRLDRATDALGRETVSKLGTTRALAGVTAVFFAVGAANLATAVRLVVRRLPSGLRGPAAGALASSHSQFAVEAVLAPIASNYYFKSAGRIMADLYNPFPLFAIVRGDLRPYAVSTPFLVVVVGLCYAYYRTPETHRRRRRLLLFGAIPVVVGFIVTVNTWGLAVAGGVVWLTLTFAPARLRSLLPAGSAVDLSSQIERATTTRAAAALARLVGALVTAGVVGVLGIVAAVPFVFGPLSSGPSTAVTTVAAGARSPLGSLLLIHGAFLAVFVAYYVARVRERWQTPAAVAVLLWFVAVVVLVPAALAPLALFGVLLAAGWYFVATDRTGFEGVLVVAGLGLVLLAEVVYIKEGGGTRFNTVVKTYMPAWVLWASAVGVILPRLVRGRRRWSWSRRQVLAGALAGVLVLSTAAFGGVALTSHFANSPVEEPTLDGMAAAENNVPGQVAGIEWLDDRSGRPTIVSAASPYLYRWSAAPAASLTGLPTVIGLPHEIQFRNRTAYFNRAYAVNTIYLGTDEQRAALLDQYGVEYIYVGPTERERYGDFASFDELRGVRVAYQEDTVTIYAVDQSRLAT
jgi:YYY domain-containing protein